MSTTAQTHAARAMAYAFARNVASMQAAYIEWTRGDGADHGMAWISNTLCGPGLLPDAGSATAQEFFDCEMEKLDKLYPDVTMNPALPSPAWCASVDAELAATADADAQPVVPELLTDAVVRRGWQHTFSTENPFCPCDLKSFTKAVRWAEMKMLTDLKTQHASDSKELRRLCQERDDLRRANSLHKVNTAALESSVGHLSTLVDELRRLLSSAMQTMSELHGSAAPDESTADIDARIPGAAFAKFVNEHAQLLFEIKNGCAAAPAPTLPATAVAEGAQLDGASLEQGA